MSTQAIGFHATDSGRAASGFVDEKCDCTVRAFAAVLNVPYQRAHYICSCHDRRRQGRFRGFYEAAPRIFRDLGHGVEELRSRGTLGCLVKHFPKGRLLVVTRGHAFAIVDGVVHDTALTGARSRVHAAWRVCSHIS